MFGAVPAVHLQLHSEVVRRLFDGRELAVDVERHPHRSPGPAVNREPRVGLGLAHTADVGDAGRGDEKQDVWIADAEGR